MGSVWIKGIVDRIMKSLSSVVGIVKLIIDSLSIHNVLSFEQELVSRTRQCLELVDCDCEEHNGLCPAQAVVPSVTSMSTRAQAVPPTLQDVITRHVLSTAVGSFMSDDHTTNPIHQRHCFHTEQQGNQGVPLQHQDRRHATSTRGHCPQKRWRPDHRSIHSSTFNPRTK